MIQNEAIKAATVQKVHYYYLGKNYKKTIKKLDGSLKYYRIAFDDDFVGLETIYDVPSNMLANAGLVLSKQLENGKYYFKVRKISNLPGGFKRPSQRFDLGQCEGSEQPKEFPTQIANAISNLFSNAFSIDLVSVVRQTEPKIDIKVKGKRYHILGGTGFECTLIYEKAVYRDVKTNKKVKRDGFTLILSGHEQDEEENKKIVAAIDHTCKELVPYSESRFEIAQRVLYPKPIEFKQEENEVDETSSN